MFITYFLNYLNYQKLGMDILLGLFPPIISVLSVVGHFHKDQVALATLITQEVLTSIFAKACLYRLPVDVEYWHFTYCKFVLASVSMDNALVYSAAQANILPVTKDPWISYLLHCKFV